MGPRFELFRIVKDVPVWNGTAETFEDAIARASQLTAGSECIVLDQLTCDTFVIDAGQYGLLVVCPTRRKPTGENRHA
jgi:hypothetical protein